VNDGTRKATASNSRSVACGRSPKPNSCPPGTVSDGLSTRTASTLSRVGQSSFVTGGGDAAAVDGSPCGVPSFTAAAPCSASPTRCARCLDTIRIGVDTNSRAASPRRRRCCPNASASASLLRDLPGWKENTVGSGATRIARERAQLSQPCAVLVGVPITIILDGTGSDQTIIRQKSVRLISSADRVRCVGSRI